MLVRHVSVSVGLSNKDVCWLIVLPADLIASITACDAIAAVVAVAVS